MPQGSVQSALGNRAFADRKNVLQVNWIQQKLGLGDSEEIADLPHVGAGRAHLAAHVLVELLSVDTDPAADMRDRGIVPAEILQVVATCFVHEGICTLKH